MKAVVCTKYGPPEALEVRDVEKFSPGDDEVLVEVRASPVSTHNLCNVTGRPFFIRLMGSGLLEPKTRIPGSELAGRVEAVGRDVKRFRAGDEVYGATFGSGFGAHAEYVSVPEAALALKPANISFEEAAAVPLAALVALQGLRDKGRIQKGQSVLIYGASGAIGTFAVQIAKYFGAEVTGVCSARNLDLVRSLGADRVIDYTREDFTRSGRRHDLIFAIASRSILAHMRALSPHGTYVSTGAPSLARILQDVLIGPVLSRNGGKRLVGGWAVNPSQRDLSFMKELIEAGKVTPVVDRCYPLSRVAEAFRHYGKGHSRGTVIVTTSSAMRDAT